jgi:hypothetical protein
MQHYVRSMKRSIFVCNDLGREGNIQNNKFFFKKRLSKKIHFNVSIMTKPMPEDEEDKRSVLFRFIKFF